MNSSSIPHNSIVAIVPAAGVGSRMQADRPKQYLPLLDKTVLEYTVNKLLALPSINSVVIALGAKDPYFSALSIATDPRVIRVNGGKERADSVLNGLNYALEHQLAEWALVHDAARPCFDTDDIEELIEQAQGHHVGAILASPVRDTMKRSDKGCLIQHTVEREQLWHALTPQLFRAASLKQALETAMTSGEKVTDEASAFEYIGQTPLIVAGKASNIKITQPEDLALAEFYLSRTRK
ncbi:2-C-methyl-D-erythritol 4-phosphate cytidylyltransferase [Vibrio sp. RC27]